MSGLNAQDIKNTTNFLLGSGAVGLAPQIIAGTVPLTSNLFDGKRLRKAVYRKTVDYTTFALNSQTDIRNSINLRRSSHHKLQPHIIYSPEVSLPATFDDCPISSMPTRFVRQAQNKKRYPVNAITWTHDARRLVTGSLNGELTLWNSLTFNFDTILQAHEDQIVVLSCSNFEEWIVSCDVKGFIKYWQSSMNNVVAFQGHLNSAITSLSFSPTDRKFVTSGIDGTVRIWDFATCCDEKIFREHGGDVCVASWHPFKGIIATGSKDSQQPIKLWDPRSFKSVHTLYTHKSAVTDIKWNPQDSNYFITAGRDTNIKLIDIRNPTHDVYVFKQPNAATLTSDTNQTNFVPNKLAWNPIHPNYFCVGSCSGSLQHWSIQYPDECLTEIEDAHDSCVNGIIWHPLGHIMVSASSDYTSKFWSRDRPGEHMTNTLKNEALNLQIEPQNNGKSLIIATDNKANDFFIPPVDYGNSFIPHIGNQTTNSVDNLSLPEPISIDILSNFVSDLTTVVPNSFYSDNPPKNLKKIL